MSTKQSLRSQPTAYGSPEITIGWSPQHSQYTYSVGVTTYSPTGINWAYTDAEITFIAKVVLDDPKQRVVSIDGEKGYGASVGHTFTVVKTHEVTVTVVDNKNRRYRARRSMFLKEAP
jgi:hypothetical protein